MVMQKTSGKHQETELEVIGVYSCLAIANNRARDLVDYGKILAPTHS